jgi:hypothetical protein
MISEFIPALLRTRCLPKAARLDVWILVIRHSALEFRPLPLLCAGRKSMAPSPNGVAL